MLFLGIAVLVNNIHYSQLTVPTTNPFTHVCYFRQEGYVFTCVCMFVSRITQKLLNWFFTKFGGNMLQKRSDFGGNPDWIRN